MYLPSHKKIDPILIRLTPHEILNTCIEYMIDISQRKKRTSSTVGLAMNAYAYGKVFIVVSDNYYTSVIRALFSVYFEF